MEVILKLDHWLKENRNEFYKKLNKGLTDNQIKDWETKFGFNFPEEFKVLYQWKNGQKPSNRECFFNHLYFDSIDIIYEKWLDNNEDLVEFNEDDNIVWGESWLCFMSTIDGNGYCLDVEGELSNKGNIIYYVHDDVNEVLFKDLKTFTEMVLEQFKQGVYGYKKRSKTITFELIHPETATEIFKNYVI